MAEEKNNLSKICVGDKEIFIKDEESRKDIEKLKNPVFDDSGSVTGIASFPDFLAKVKSKMNIFGFFRDFAAGMKFVLHTGQLVNNCVSDRTDLPLAAKQGKVLAEELAKLNSDLKLVLTENILTYACSSSCNIGFSSGVFPGVDYAYTEELPNPDIKYGTWEINKRSTNTMTVKVFSPYKSTMWINSYVNTYGWRGWEQLATTSDFNINGYANSNLNNIIQNGLYWVENTTNETLNFPEDSINGWLQVIHIASGNAVKQIFWRYGTKNTTGNVFYMRNQYTDGWSNWIKFAGSSV